MLQLSLFNELEAPASPDKLGAATIGLRPGSKVLTVPRGVIGDFDYSLNPYVGCGFGCSYCYAANFVADDQRRADWGNWVDIKVDAEKQLARADLQGKRIYMSSATDPYQPIEQRVRLTRRILEILVPKQPRLVVQTRSPLVTRDIDLLSQLDSVRVNMSITTDSEDVRKRFEPACASIDRRLEAAAEIAGAGIPVAVCISPMLPIDNPRGFARRIMEIGPVAVHTSYFHQSERPFAASTADKAVGIARDLGWDRYEYSRTLKELSRYLPLLKPWDNSGVEQSRHAFRKSA
jgi:DNA repair photolyase